MNLRKLAIIVALGCGPMLIGYAADAKTTWTERCAKCHGAGGKGDTKMGRKLEVKDYTEAKVQANFTDEAAIKALKEGIKDRGGATRMKAVEGLPDDEAKALVAYVRSLKQ